MNKFKLRKYQEDCLDRLMWSQTLPGNDLVSIPTAGGKSIVVAELAHKLGKPILILQPSKELVEQNLEKLSVYVDRSEIGIYSASMDEKIVKKFTLATIGSIYKKPELFEHFEIVLIDEAHKVNPKNLKGMYTKFLSAIGNPKVIGLTASPYRMDSFYRRTGNGKYDLETVTTVKLINRTKPHFWGRIVYNVTSQELLRQGYLCPLKYFDAPLVDHSEIPLNKSKSDFSLVSYESLIAGMTNQIKKAIKYGQENHKSVLVFCSSVEQAKNLSKITPGSAMVSAKTKKKDRNQIVKDFKNLKIQTIFNVGVLTTGFDHPELDCIILIRPTKSIGLYQQMLGRGVRIAPGKKFCSIIDMTSTVRHLGRVETIRIEKIAGKWQLLSETGSWHNKELYTFSIKRRLKPNVLPKKWEKV